MKNTIFQKIRSWVLIHKKLAVGLALLLCAAIAAVLLILAPQKNEGVEYLIGVSQPNISDNMQLELYQDIELRCKEYESVRFVSFDAGYSADKQKTDIDNLLLLEIDALIVVTFEPENIADAIERAYKSGIPVIIIGYPPQNDAYTLRIYTDNITIGQMAGEYVKKLSAGRICTVLEIQGEPRSRISIDLKNGFFEGIEPYDNITKEYVMTGYWSQEKTRARMNESQFFSKEPAINVIFAHNDMMALGAAVNLKQTRNSAYIISVGGYSVKNSDLPAIKEGMINTTFTYSTGGSEAVDAAMKLMHGEVMPSQIELPPQIVNKDNVDKFLRHGGNS